MALISDFCVVIFVILLCYFIKLKWRRRRLVEMVNKFDGPPILPIFGNALSFVGSTKEILHTALDLLERYKNPSRIWLFHVPYVIISDPEDFQIVANKALEKDHSYRFLADLIGDGLITASVAKWKKNRRVIYPIFNRTILYNNYLDIFNKQNLKLIESLKHEVDTGKHFDAWLYIFKTFFHIVSETAMGHNLELEDIDTLKKLKDNTLKASLLAGKRIYQPWLQPSIIFKLYTFFKGWGNVFEESKEVPLRILRTKREKFFKNQSKNTDAGKEKSQKNFIDLLLQSHEANHLTNKDMADEVLTIMFAATETSALISSFTQLMLAEQPDIQEKVYEEIYNVFGDSDRLVTADDLPKLTLLEQCVKESLRLFNAVPIVIRRTDEDLQISNGKIIPAGANIVLAIIGVHLDPNLYPNPKQWNPHNFDEDKVAARHPAAYVPFSLGPRMCIGYKQSLVSIMTQLSLILRNFKLSTDEKGYELDIDFLIRSARGFRIKLTKRQLK